MFHPSRSRCTLGNSRCVICHCNSIKRKGQKTNPASTPGRVQWRLLGLLAAGFRWSMLQAKEMVHSFLWGGGGGSTSMKQQPITGSDGLRERRKTDDPNSSLLVSRRVAFISMRLTAHPLAHGPLQNEPSTSR